MHTRLTGGLISSLLATSVLAAPQIPPSATENVNFGNPHAAAPIRAFGAPLAPPERFVVGAADLADEPNTAMPFSPVIPLASDDSATIDLTPLPGLAPPTDVALRSDPMRRPPSIAVVIDDPADARTPPVTLALAGVAVGSALLSRHRLRRRQPRP